ncbi:hypothetical protein PN476_11580 [Dolichospermum circinale CS-537/05]|nr:hypothetical protein [Dolichospermum circinale CS-537/05]
MTVEGAEDRLLSEQNIFDFTHYLPLTEQYWGLIRYPAKRNVETFYETSLQQF